jgi:hypothetical protein
MYASTDNFTDESGEEHAVSSSFLQTKHRSKVIGVVLGATGLLVGAVSVWKPQRSVRLSGLQSLAEDKEGAQCAVAGQDCSVAGCCENPDLKCFKKNDWWSSCNSTCSETALWDHQVGGWVDTGKKNWDCTEVSPNPDADLAGVQECTEDGVSCLESRCCSNPDSQCYFKEAGWASCRNSCDKNSIWDFEENDWVKTEKQIWSCEVLRPVEEETPSDDVPECSPNGADCRTSKCCTQVGSKCYVKAGEDDDIYWASCNASCTTTSKWDNELRAWTTVDEDVWSCEELTPSDPDGPPPGTSA